MPNWAGTGASPTWTSAEMACAAIGIVAPASSTAPCRTGRQSAAAMTAAANAIITATSPAITRPGLEKALPAVSDCTCPAAVRSVKLSHAGANAAATPRPASTTSTIGPSADPRGRAIAPAGPDEAAARNRDPGPARNATTVPAAQTTQPMRESTRPAPPPEFPAAEMAVPASAKNRPHVTALSPTLSSLPRRRPGPPRGCLRPPLERPGPRPSDGPDAVEAPPAPYLVGGSAVRDGHVVKHDPSLP